MLELICGRAGSGKTAYCLDTIQKELLARPMGPAIILLLPEHMTYKVERQLAMMMAEKGAGFVRCYVYGFRRFAQQVLAETGGGLEPGLTELGRQLLLKKILGNKRDEMKVFGKAARQRGFAKTLGKILDELKSYSIFPEQLASVQEKVKDNRLKGKLADLAVLQSEFNAQMAGRFQDKGDMLNRLIEKIPVSDIVKGAEVWLDGFLFFNPQERLILQGLINHAENVHVTLTLEPDYMDTNWENTKTTGTFFRSYFTLENLRKMAEEMDLKLKMTPLDGNHRFLSAPLAKIQQEMYTFRKKGEGFGEISREEQQESVNIIEAANARLEMEAVAADILRLVRDKGYKWQEIGVLIRDQETYGASLPLVFQDYGIPYFSDHKRPCANHQLAELIRSAINLVRTGWQYDSVFRCLKTGFFLPNSEELDLLENYVLEFGIKGSKKWLQEKDWDFFRRYALDEDDPSDEEKERIKKVNDIRHRIIIPLENLHNKMKAGENTRDITSALYEFLLELDVPKKLESWAREAENCGMLAEAKEHQKVWQDVMSLLDQLVELSGDEKMSLQEYEAIVGEGLDALQVSMIPPGVDYVTIASFEQNSLDNQRAVYIMGAVAGAMPRRTTENMILSDADRLHLEEAVKRDKEMEALSIVGRDNSFNEKYIIYKAFTLAREYFCISYPLADSEGNGREPANLVKRIRELVPEANFLSLPLESLAWQPELQEMMIAEGRTAVSGLAAALRNAREKQLPLDEIWQKVYNWSLEQNDMKEPLKMIREGLFFEPNRDQLTPAMAQKLFTNKKLLKASVSKLESFRSCHFKYFAQYGLKLHDRQEYKFRVMDFGTLLHGVLHDFGIKMKEEKRRWNSVSGDECRKICRDLLYAKAAKLPNNIMMSSKQKEAQLERIYHTACHVLLRLCAFDGISAFHPEEFEEKFDTATDKDINMFYDLLDECKLAITGSIDRIDKMEGELELDDHFMIIDYKSSKHSLDEQELYYGLNMQLITYLLVATNIMSIKKNKPVLPAAMLYCLLQTKIVEADNRLNGESANKKVLQELRLDGWFMGAMDVLQKIDPSMDYVNLDLSIGKTTGTIKKAMAKKIISTTDFSNMMKFVEKMLETTGNEIISGDIKVEPVKFGNIDACKFCDYRALCGYSPDISGYSPKNLVKHENDEVMKLIAKELGEKNDVDR